MEPEGSTMSTTACHSSLSWTRCKTSMFK